MQKVQASRKEGSGSSAPHRCALSFGETTLTTQDSTMRKSLHDERSPSLPDHSLQYYHWRASDVALSNARAETIRGEHTCRVLLVVMGESPASLCRSGGLNRRHVSLHLLPSFSSPSTRRRRPPRKSATVGDGWLADNRAHFFWRPFVVKQRREKGIRGPGAWFFVWSHRVCTARPACGGFFSPVRWVAMGCRFPGRWVVAAHVHE